MRTCPQCERDFEPNAPHQIYDVDACRQQGWVQKEVEAAQADVQRVESGVGSRGGNVRSVEGARDLQSEQREKRNWSAAIDELIRRTLIGTGYFHADDIDPLGVPPEHCNLKGTRTAWFRNQGFMEKSGAERKVSHAAANGRKAPIYRITKKGRARLAGLDAGGSSGGRAASVEPGESGIPISATGRAGQSLLPADAGAASPDQLHIGDSGKEKVHVGASSAYNPGNEWA